MRLGTRKLAAAAPAGPLNVSTTRKLITSAELPASASTEVTSAAKSDSAHSYHCAGCASWAKRQACAVPISSCSATKASTRAVIGAMLRFAPACRHVMDHVWGLRASRTPENCQCGFSGRRGWNGLHAHSMGAAFDHTPRVLILQ